MGIYVSVRVLRPRCVCVDEDTRQAASLREEVYADLIHLAPTTYTTTIYTTTIYATTIYTQLSTGQSRLAPALSCDGAVRRHVKGSHHHRCG
jgi:hypothetical protein